jgi:DNA repair/transcription protein MET18/MMS19
MLYKQKFFAFLLPKIVQGYKSALGDDQAVYLVALSCLLQHIPRQMALTELPKVSPVPSFSLFFAEPILFFPPRA